MADQVGIGIDIGGTSIKYGIVNIEGTIEWEAQKPSNAQSSRPKVEGNIIAGIKEAFQKAKGLGVKVRSIGVGTPGLVTQQGIVLGGGDNIIDWDNIPLRKIIEDQLGLPTFVRNDADMMAIGEVYAFKIKPTTAIFFTIGTGIGGAMIINGKLFSGHFGLGGELGVFPIMIDGKVRNWEEVASTAAMVNAYREKCQETDAEINGKYIVKQYLEKESIAIETINKSTHLIGMGIAGYINIFNPEMVIIGGGISEAGDFFIEKIKAYAHEYALEPCVQNVKIISASLGNRAGFVGAGIYGLLSSE
ncbi:MAG: glucokinase [Saprospiraceae bacterium]|jgi:glucokinase